jgi:transposase
MGTLPSLGIGMNMCEDNSSFGVFVGIDWADTKHDVCLQGTDTTHRVFEQFSHRPADIDAWVQSLRTRFAGPFAIALELSKGPIVYALQKHDDIVIYPINPTTLAKYRVAFKPSRAKDDPTDAELALDILLKHPEHFQRLNPQSVEMRTLASLVEHRRRLVGDKVRLTNRIRSTLKQYYPQTLEWFDRIDTRLFCDFIERWPTLAQVKRARRSTLVNFFQERNMRFAHVLEARIASIREATPLTEDVAVITPHRLQALTLVDLLRVTLSSIKRFDEAIAELAPKHPDYQLFSALPGAGPTYAPRLLVAFGEQRERYKNASEIQQFSGIAPVTERSGKKSWVHWRWQCPTFVRQTFVEWAAQTINKSYWAGLYYHQQRAKGCSYQAAVRSLAFKWIRILYRCWVTRTPYDEAKYLKALRERGSPLLSVKSA